MIEIRPQKGAQEDSLACPADILIMGAGAGTGKTWTLVVEPLRHVDKKDFSAILFRRTSVQLHGDGSMWELACKYYPAFGASMTSSPNMVAKFPKSRISFSHLQLEKDKYDHDGKAYTYIAFDEVQHFSESQFIYLMSRNRNKGDCMVKPYIRCGCNPMPNSWLLKYIGWWIGEDGYPIFERSGVLRYFIMTGDKIEWVDEGYRDSEGNHPTSISFIPGRLSDNLELLKIDPQYRRKLMLLPKHERDRLLGGNWKSIDLSGAVYDGYSLINTPEHYPKVEEYRYIFGGYDRGFAHNSGVCVVGITYDMHFHVLKSIGLNQTPFFSDEQSCILDIMKQYESEIEQETGQKVVQWFVSHEANEHISIARRKGINAVSWLKGFRTKHTEAKNHDKTKTNQRHEFVNLLLREGLLLITQEHQQLLGEITSLSYKRLPDGSYNRDEIDRVSDDLADSLSFCVGGYSAIRNEVYKLLMQDIPEEEAE